MDEQLQKTSMIKKLFIEEDDISIIEKIEEFEDKVDYLDLKDSKKEQIKDICEKIKCEKEEKTQEFLFKLLQRELENKE